MGFGFFTRRADRAPADKGEKRGRIAFRSLVARSASLTNEVRAVRTTVETSAASEPAKKKGSTNGEAQSSQQRDPHLSNAVQPKRPCRFVVTPHKLGAGAYGSVLLGSDLCSGENVAIKFIADGRMKPASLAREIAMLRRLSEADHPALLRFYAHVPPPEVRAGELKARGSLPLSKPMGTCHALVMEAARGGELFEHVVARDGLDELVAGPIFAQVVDAVRAAHSLGIAHRDLKLENVLLCGKAGEPDERQIKLIDWGLAHQHAIGPDGQPVPETLHSRCGSRSYMAPEVTDRAVSSTVGYNGFVSDVWSLGVCLFAILLGFFPFEQADPAVDWRARRVVEAQLRGESTMRTIFSFYPHKSMRLSEPVLQLLDRMLVFDPCRRATLAEIVSSAWLAPCMPTSPMEMELDLAVRACSSASASSASYSASATPPMSPRALERQDSGSTAVSIGSSVASSVAHSMARLRQLEAHQAALPPSQRHLATTLPPDYAEQWEAVRYAVASGTLPSEQVRRLSSMLARTNVAEKEGAAHAGAAYAPSAPQHRQKVVRSGRV